MVINWLSPLQPDRSGVASYTLRLLPHLVRRCDVRLWSAGEDWPAALERHGEVRRFTGSAEDWRRVNEAALTVVNIGNEGTQHGWIWRFSQVHPSLVILHDTHLQHMLAWVFLSSHRDPEGYVEIMRDLYGGAGERASRSYLAGRYNLDRLSETFSGVEAVVVNAAAVLVHSAAAREALRWAGAPVEHCGLPSFPVERASGGRPGKPLRLLVAGFLGPNRCLTETLEALADERLRDRCRLRLVGKVWDREALNAEIGRLGLKGRVRVDGQVSPRRWAESFADADVLVNLRNPTMGESSSVQLEGLANGLPSVVTRQGWYAELPESLVRFVESGREVEGLVKHLGELLVAYPDPGDFARRSSDHLKAFHDSELYVDTLLSLIDKGCSHLPRTVGRSLGAKVTASLTGWLLGPSATLVPRVEAALDEIVGRDERAWR